MVVAEAVVKVGIIDATSTVAVVFSFASALWDALVVNIDKLSCWAEWLDDRTAVEILSRGLGLFSDDRLDVASLAHARVGRWLPGAESTLADAG